MLSFEVRYFKQPRGVVRDKEGQNTTADRGDNGGDGIA
jgi:hypothetical protein